MDLEDFIKEVEIQMNEVKNELFEVRQLLKFAFKEDIFKGFDARETSPVPRKLITKYK
jgi:hypothetical protein